MNTVFALYLEALGLSPAYWHIEAPTFTSSYKSLHLQWRYSTSSGISTSSGATTTRMAPREAASFLITAQLQQAYQQLMNAVAYFQVGLVQFADTDTLAAPLPRSEALTVVAELLQGPWHQAANHSNFPSIEPAQTGYLESTVLRKGRTVSFLETTLYTDQAQLIAHSQHTFQLS